jgi:hypothetical protein
MIFNLLAKIGKIAKNIDFLIVTKVTKNIYIFSDSLRITARQITLQQERLKLDSALWVF